MNKNYVGTLMFLLLLLIVNSLLLFVFLEKDSKVKFNGEVEEVCIEDNCFPVEIAKNDKDRALGLMFRVSLDRLIHLTYDKKKFLEKYGIHLMMFAFLIVLVGGMWFIIHEVGKAVEPLRNSNQNAEEITEANLKITERM